jgi:NTP pyrophosphatase (non-canonical NTP hydrolase)
VSNLDQLTGRIRDFARARAWEQFHTPKNLSMALAGEVGELLAELQWLTDEQARTIMAEPDAATRIRGEIADVFIYLLRLADVLGIHLVDVAHAKLDENEHRYDVESHYGSARKAPPLG